MPQGAEESAQKRGSIPEIKPRQIETLKESYNTRDERGSRYCKDYPLNLDFIFDIQEYDRGENDVENPRVQALKARIIAEKADGRRDGKNYGDEP
jgi:hypothetical protein